MAVRPIAAVLTVFVVACTSGRDASNDTTPVTMTMTTTVTTASACDSQPDPDNPYYAADTTYVDPSMIAWDTAKPSDVGLDEALLERGADNAVLSPNVASMLVARHGKLVFERYFNGGDASQANDVHSLSKSLLSVLTGIAIDDGRLSLDTTIDKVLAPDVVGANGDLTIRDLVTMSGGLQLRTNEGDYDWEVSDVEQGLPFARAVLQRPRVRAAGSTFEYSTGLTQVLATTVADAVGEPLCNFAAERLYGPLGIDVDGWWVDAAGYYSGGHSVFLTPREIARFGQLVLDRGEWNGEQLVPSAWLDESLGVRWDLGCLGLRVSTLGYGYLWWLNDIGGHRVWTASGAGGQDLHIVPDLDLVMVVTHTTHGDPDLWREVPTVQLLKDYVVVGASDLQGEQLSDSCNHELTANIVSADGSGVVGGPELARGTAQAWSPDSDRLAWISLADLNSEVYTTASDGSDPRRLTRDFATDVMPAWSPHGEAIAFARGDPGKTDLYRVDEDGNHLKRLTAFEGFEEVPTWSPDGDTIAFVRGRRDVRGFGDTGALWTITADGNDPQLVLGGPVAHPTWSPAGDQIAVELPGDGDTATQVGVLELASGVVTGLTDGYVPSWSPDGTRIAFTSDRDGDFEVYTMAADGTDIVQLTHNETFDTFPMWSPDGESILYLSSQ